MFVDDLQWAGRTQVGFIDIVLGEEPIEWLLLVGAYREGEVDAAHPLAGPLALWRDQVGVRQLRLDNLPVSASVTIVAEMLHVAPAAAARLAGVIEAHTSGNPYQTVELLNALRRDGLLNAAGGGWRWDAAAVRAHLGASEVAGLGAARADALPTPSMQMVQAMACLGGRAELSLLQAATGQPAGAVDQALAPALSEGLLVAEPGAHPAVRFRHDRIREVILATPGDGRPADLVPGRSPVTTGTIDLLGILSAPQALSSETSLERLHARVAQVLSAMTGATGVHLVLWSEERHDWLLPVPGGTAPVTGTGHETAVPMSVLRYTQRTGEPLVADDATHDDRFARDPYFTDVGCCALLALPILSRGALRGVLLLENRLIRGAFTSDRLDAVQLIVGQLAVSLDNAQLYAELSASRARIVATADQTRRRIERDLHDGAQQRLVSLVLQLRAAQAAAPPEAAEIAQQVGDVAAVLAGTLDELREIAHGLHPAILAEGGLRLALKAVARRCAVPVRLDVGVARRLPEPAEIAAYYAVSEALTNTIKHAHASAADVEASARDGVLHVRVSDDGRGGAAFGPGSGLIGLKDRIEAAGGRITLRSPPGAGTTVQITLPLTDPSSRDTADAAAGSPEDPSRGPAAAPGPPAPARES
jgi:signal transduction histidine kinase